MQIQRVRNLTTGILHTEIQHIYEDIEWLTGEKGIMTHMLPAAMQALTFALQAQLSPTQYPDLWDGKFNPTGPNTDIPLRPLNAAELVEFWKLYKMMAKKLWERQ